MKSSIVEVKVWKKSLSVRLFVDAQIKSRGTINWGKIKRPVSSETD